MNEEKRVINGRLNANKQSDKQSVEGELSGIERYDDIIDLPRPKMKHARMSAEARAAQFAPFAALVGFYDKVAQASQAKLDEMAEQEAFEVDIDAQIETEETEEIEETDII